MAQFSTDYAKNKADQGRLLKAKFSVRPFLPTFVQYFKPSFVVLLEYKAAISTCDQN